MASSGYFNTSGYEGRYLQFSWKETGQNVASNTTTISWTLKGAGGGNVWYKAGNFKVVIAGETVFSSSTRIQLDNGTIVASGSYTFKHNADGTKQFTASVQAGIYTVAVNCTGSATFTLDTIARASQPSCITWPEHTQDVGYFGDEISIHMNRNSSDFTHTVRYEFGTKSGTIATGVETGVKWVIPLSLMDLLPAATSGSGTIYVDTYNGSTKIGTKWCGFTAKVPASVKPKCTIQVLDATNIKDTYGNLVRGLSKLYVKTTGAAAYSSPIASYNVSANGVRYTDDEITTGVISKAGTTTITATVKDKRGRTSDAVSASFTVLDYTAPVVSELAVHRCDADGTENGRGGYIKITFAAAISSINSKNTALYYLRYKKSTASAYTEISFTDLTNKYSVSNYQYIFAADSNSSYTVEVVAKDRHNTASKGTSASTAFTTINFHPDGTGLRFGGVAEESGAFQNDLVFIQTNNQYAFSSVGAASTDGYILMARIKVTASNSDTPITFEFSQRKAKAPMKVHVCFASSSDTDPALSSCVYEGENYDAYLSKSAASVWDLYVKKVSNSDTITLNRWSTSYRQMKRVTVDFIGTIVSTVPTGLVGYYKATPLPVRSILDSIFPVGYILLLYSHANPNTMYPGTTWERISGAFPWFTDSSGTIGQTGGAKEVTLTTAQIPSHTHGSVYSGNASGDKTLPWLSTSVLGTGDKLAYSTIATGGGEAHNNMPPYIQISAWRRTA